MLKVATVCSGIGSPEQALKDNNTPHEVVFACEIDKHARASYNAIHEAKTMYTDMTKEAWDLPEQYADLFIGGIPCQSFSLAGKRLGEMDPRGLLFFDFLRCVKNQQPKVFIIENVKGLLSDNKGRTFENWCMLLGKSINGNGLMLTHPDTLGYNLHYTVLNTKNFGLPQNRERVFLVGFRADMPNDFRFPIGWPLDKRLRDVLEVDVDEKYYLSEKILKGFINDAKNQLAKGFGFDFKPKTGNDISGALSTDPSGRKTGTFIAEIDNIGHINQNTQASQVYGINGINPALSAGTHGYAQGYIKVNEATKQGFAITEPYDSINLSNPNSETRRGRVGKQIANTLDTACNQAVVEPICGAMRGRNPDNPNDRNKGIELQQLIQLNANPSITNTITSVQKDNLIVELSVKQINPSTESGGKQPYQQNRVYDSDELAPTIDTGAGRWAVTDPQLTQIGQLDGFESTGRIYDENGISCTIKANGGGGGAKTGYYNTNSRIRRLTPLECFRLQGYPDEFFYKCAAVNSDTQLYKQAGNTISTPVIKAVIYNILRVINQ
jgi:DNA (cytosine-5)-methyltransferase 1